MKYIKEEAGIQDADGAEDAEFSSALIQQRMEAVREQLLELPEDADASRRVELQLRIAGSLLDLERKQEAWDTARAALDLALSAQDWEQAALACDILFRADQPDSLAALGQGVWLAVTYPVDPELTVALLDHIVDETPDDADGAAVAAATAHYVTDLRAKGKQREDLTFFTNNMLGTVARRHSQVQNQEQFDAWVERLELNDPAAFLPRLRNVVDVLVQDEWWFDRDALQRNLPVN